jgi:adenylate kinase family enzyme
MGMRKVLVIGSGGAGKSTFARRLGELLELEVIHLDSLYWSAGRVEMPKAEWQRAVEELLSRQAWIIDGNYSATLQMRLEACDTVIFLDMSRLICHWRLLKRVVLYRNERRPDMAEGCPEKLDWKFIRWVWEYPARTRPKIIELLEKSAGDKQIVWLQSRAEVKRFFVSARPT